MAGFSPRCMVKFLVLALFYGDYPALAQRCASSLRLLWNTGRVDLRVGFNEVAPRSRAIVGELLPGAETESAQPQIYKYPMMRRLVGNYGGDATHMMWFDDDSCLRPDVHVRGWLNAVSSRAGRTQGSLGALYTTQLSTAQQDWVRRQPWYTGRPFHDPLLFNAGAWTVLPLELMRRCDYPGPQLRHNGGDTMLGALLHQQGLVPEQFRVGLAIGADAELREAAQPRRGLAAPGGDPIPEER
jgi:hypothetical protein